MAKKAHFAQDELLQAFKIRDEATTVTEFRKAMSVILRFKLKLSANKAAKVLGVCRSTVFRDRREFCDHDNAVKKLSWGGRRRFSLSMEEERKFLATWEAKAASGGILSVPAIHAALVKLLGHATNISTTYRMLARHGWRKVQPDTKHPKSDSIAQEEFKKKFQKLWIPHA